MKKYFKYLMLLLIFLLVGCDIVITTSSPSSKPTSPVSSTKPINKTVNEVILYDLLYSKSIKGNIEAVIDGQTSRFYNFEMSGDIMRISYEDTILTGSDIYIDQAADEIYVNDYYYYVGANITFNITYNSRILNKTDRGSSFQFSCLPSGFLFTTLQTLQINAEAFIENDRVTKIETNYDISSLFSEDSDPGDFINSQKTIINIEDYSNDIYEIFEKKDSYTNDKDTVVSLTHNPLDQYVADMYAKYGYNEYRLEPTESTYYCYINQPETIDIRGYLKRAYGDPIYIRVIKIVEGVDFSTPGTYTAKIKCTYLDKDYYSHVKIMVAEDSIVPKYKINLPYSPKDIFLVNNYLLATSKTTLYKYDADTLELLGSIELGCQTIKTLLKDNKLYITARDMNVNGGMDDYKYAGKVAIIDLEEFTIIEDIEVNFYPFGIIVDNRNDVIVSMGRDQHTDIVKINFESDIYIRISTSSYSEDELYYDSVGDKIILVSTRLTGYYDILAYDSSQEKYVRDTKTPTQDLNDGFDSFYVDDYIITPGREIYKQNGDTFDVIGNLNKTITRTLDADIHGDYIYYIRLESPPYDNEILIYNYKTGDKTSYLFSSSNYGGNRIEASDSYIYVSSEINTIFVYENKN